MGAVEGFMLEVLDADMFLKTELGFENGSAVRAYVSLSAVHKLVAVLLVSESNTMSDSDVLLQMILNDDRIK